MSEQAPLVPAASHRVALTVKKSRFIAHAEGAESRSEALAVVERVRGAFPDARHHCWAYLVGDPAGSATAATSDDGEPSGTAGRPILNVIQHKGIADVLVVVVRYFGGIKLGAGGLVRAYAGATEAVLAELPLARHEPRSRVRLHMDFASEQPLRHWAQTHGGRVESVDYGTSVRVTLDVPDAQAEALRGFCAAHDVVVE